MGQTVMEARKMFVDLEVLVPTIQSLYDSVNPKNRSKPPSKNGLPFQRTRNPHLEYRFLAWSWVERCRWITISHRHNFLAAKRDDQDIMFCTLSFVTVFGE